MDNLLSSLISSKTRVKLLIRFFLNPHARSYLRELAKEFDVSTNSVREELNQLTQAHLLKSEKSGRNVFYHANTEHALFPELRSMVFKVVGVNQVIEVVIEQLENIEKAFLISDYAEGKDTGIIDILLVAPTIDTYRLSNLTQKAECYTNRKIRSLVLSCAEYQALQGKFDRMPRLLIWQSQRR